jgi:hypothetical protein
LGNCSNDALLIVLGEFWPNIDAELVAGARVIVVRTVRLEILP